ncbi:formyltransferase family protein [Flavobacterium suncheonense]|uniref:formyltransferase family protein n=1 Tax=Flavobacterium suncheonense TaxID=350894 RepID=UPI0003F4BB77|nr:formyltransferase family protein [Flavobacterium suncheonense]
MNRIVFLVSGGGGSLKFIFYALEALKMNVEVVGVIADRDCTALDFAADKNIYARKIKYNRTHTEELQQELRHLAPDVIVTNIHKIIDTETLSLYPERFVNLHYSLLPAFGGVIGMETVAQAKIQNVGFVGGSCHMVNEEVDAGKILHQSSFPVDWDKDEQVIDTVFKSSSLLLLGGIFTILKIDSGSTKQAIINNKHITFSPALPYTVGFLSEVFWKKVAE